MATLITKNSSTASSIPTAAQLVQGELAVNVADKRLFTENSAGAVVELGTNPSSITTGSATITGGTVNNVVIGASAPLAGSFTTLAVNGGTSSLLGVTVSPSGWNLKHRFNVPYAGNTPVLSNNLNPTSLTSGTLDDTTSTGSALTFGPSGTLDFGVATAGAGTRTITNYATISSTGLAVTGALSASGNISTSNGNVTTAGSNNEVSIGPRTGTGGATLYNPVGDQLRVYLNGSDRAVVSATGLAVTGALSATGTLNVPNIERTTAGDLYINASALAGQVTINTAGFERVRVDSAGNLGLGVVPSAWGSIYVAAQIGSTGSLHARAGGIDLVGLSSNTYRTNSAVNYLLSGLASTLYQQTSGVHQWFTAPSGTAGAAINFTQAMTLDAGGNLGIGTSSPAHKLDVAGAVKSGYLGVVGTSGAFNTASRFGVDHTGTDARLYSSGADNATKGVFQFRQQGANGVIDAEAMRIDANGNVGIGTSAPEVSLHVTGTTVLSTNTISEGSIELNQRGTGDRYSLIDFHSSGAPFANDFSARILRTPGVNAVFEFGNTGTGSTRFLSNGVETVRIDASGSLLVGTTSNPNTTRLTIDSGNASNTTFVTSASGATALCLFRNPNGNVGSIQTSASATSYVTSSDYRLKNTIAPMTGALAKVALLKPVTYKWNADGSDGQGFIAHELAEVEPGCVTGEKDETELRTVETSPAIPAVTEQRLVSEAQPAVEEVKDEDGNVTTEAQAATEAVYETVETSPAVAAVTEEQVFPKYQGIDTSFLVATLAAAIQEQQVLIKDLTARLAALEAA